MKNGKLRVAGYIRVSDKSQLEGHSLPAQEASIRRWCDARGHELVKIYREDGATAHSDRLEKRPVLVSLLGEAPQHHYDLVAVDMVDRWARNMVIQGQTLQRLGEAKVGFASAKEDIDFTTPGGKLMLNMLGSAAQFFSDQLGVHVSKSQGHKAELGLPVGPTPFAYDVLDETGIAVLDQQKGRAVLEAFRKRDRGETYSQIACWLNGQGFRTKDGNAFTAHAVKDMLRCRFYTGVVIYRGQEYPGRHKAVVSEELFQRVEARKSRRTFQRRVDGERGLLQGRIACVRCGQPLHADRHRDGKPMYRERHCHECTTNNLSLMSHFVDDQVGDIFGAFTLPEDWKDRIAKLATVGCGDTNLAKLVERRKKLYRAYTEGDAYSEDVFNRKLADLDAQIRAAQPVSQPGIEEAVALLSDLPALWQEATSEERLRLMAPLIERAYIDVELRCIAALVPKPAFRSLLQEALDEIAQPTCVLIEATADVDWAQWWTWWRRGRPQPQDLHHYRVVHPPRPEWGAYAVVWRRAA